MLNYTNLYGICQTCYDYIREFCNFQKSIHQAQSKLLSDVLHHDGIKQELSDEKNNSMPDNLLGAGNHFMLLETFLERTFEDDLMKCQHQNESYYEEEEEERMAKHVPPPVNSIKVEDEFEIIDLPDDYQLRDEFASSLNYSPFTEQKSDDPNPPNSDLKLMYECEFCGSFFLSIEDLKLHVTDKCNPQLSHVSCKECGVLFATKKDLAKHRLIHNLQSCTIEDGDTPYEDNSKSSSERNLHAFKKKKAKKFGDEFKKALISRKSTKISKIHSRGSRKPVKLAKKKLSTSKKCPLSSDSCAVEFKYDVPRPGLAIPSSPETIQHTDTFRDKVRAHLRDHLLNKLKK